MFTLISVLLCLVGKAQLEMKESEWSNLLLTDDILVVHTSFYKKKVKK